MNNSELHREPKQKIRSVAVYIAYFITILMILLLLCTSKSVDLRFNNEQSGRLTHTWRIDYGEQSVLTSLPFQTDIPAGETVTYSIILPKSRTDSGLLYNSVMFRAVHEYVKVYLDKEKIYEFGYEQSVFFSDDPANGWLIVRLPNDFAGKVLTIEKTGYYDNDAGILNDFFLGTKNALVFYVLNNSLPLLFINFTIILLSLCLLLGSFYFKRKYTVSQLRYLSIFFIITSIWLTLESGGYQLFAGNSVMISNLVFLTFSLIPLVFVRLLLTYECFLDSRYMNVLFYCCFGSFLLIHFLQLVQWLNYLESITITHCMLLMIMLGILGRYIWMKKQKKKIINRFLFVSCFTFAIFAFIDIVRFYLLNPERPTLFSQIGFLFYFIILCYFAIRKIASDNEASMNKLFFQQMAYTDLLTGLPNRNAFEREAEYYKTENTMHPSILIMDLNGLKTINDSFGHSQGDNAIVQAGHFLRECFSEKGHVFRIGGDEFCAVFQEIDIDTLNLDIKNLRDKIDESSKELSFKLSVAVGFAMPDEKATFIQTFSAADNNMYEDKKRNKIKAEENNREEK